MKFRDFSTLILVLFAGFRAIASPEDTVKKEVKIPTLIKYIDDRAFTSQQVLFHLLDTTLNTIETVNPAVEYHYNFLSNIGSAASPQLFLPRENLFSDIGFHTYDLYIFNETKIRYFKTNKAYSEIIYHLGGGKEAQITVALSQNITKNWNAGLDFNRLGSEGFLKNGSTFHNNINLYTWLHSDNNRYNLFAYAYWNSIENHVNGGLHSDSVFDNSSVSNIAMQGLLVNLTDAENHFRNHKFSLRQFYDLGSKIEEKISDTTSRYHFNPSARIEYSINLESRSFTYLDVNPGDYYKNTFFYISTRDSLHYYDLRNRVSLLSLPYRKNNPDKLRLFYYSAGMEHQWLRYAQFASPGLQFLDEIFENTSVFGSLSNRDDEHSIFLKASAEYIFQGENKDDYKAEGQVRVPLKQYGLLNASVNTALKSPGFIYQRYYSNHFTWENNFEKSAVKNIWAEYSLPQYKISIGAEATTISHFIYLDSTALPVQTFKEIRVLKYFLNKNFRLGKFHLNNAFIVQKINDDKVLHLPSLVSTQSLFYESAFYNKALLVQIGFDFNFSSLYYADAFMPATGLFYLQNEKKTNGYALADFFVNFRIKTARVFVKLENITDIFSGTGYYLTPHYPMQGTTLKFGFRWRFFDQ
jgi:hypothetical protein